LASMHASSYTQRQALHLLLHRVLTTSSTKVAVVKVVASRLAAGVGRGSVRQRPSSLSTAEPTAKPTAKASTAAVEEPRWRCARATVSVHAFVMFARLVTWCTSKTNKRTNKAGLLLLLLLLLLLSKLLLGRGTPRHLTAPVKKKQVCHPDLRGSAITSAIKHKHVVRRRPQVPSLHQERVQGRRGDRSR